MKARQIVLIDRQAYRLRVEDYRRIEATVNPDALKEILLSIKKNYKPLFSVNEIFTSLNKNG